VDKYVDKLVQLTLYYNIDGWLINIENKIDATENLVYFVKQLTRALRSIDEGLYRVIWYDSVVETGELKWQNELNRSNECFFNVCDGIFVNYTWTFENLANSGLYAERLRDIYIGVDVFGRNCQGGGGFSTRLAVEKIQEYDLSCAIFAPGWVIECNEAADFINTNDKFWHLLDSSTERRRISSLPVLTAFTHSRAERFFCLGENVSGRTSWCNLNLQSLMPVLKDSSNFKWCFEDAFYAGSCLIFDNKASANKLFDLSVALNAGTCLRVEYAVKVECSTAIDYVKKLKICLGYVTEENSNGVICSDSSVPISSDVEVIESNSSVNSSGWYLETFDALVKKCLSLRELTVVNSGLPGQADTVKLGNLLKGLRLFCLLRLENFLSKKVIEEDYDRSICRILGFKLNPNNYFKILFSI
jgi:endo-beta-N-acetylglucosaminidase D